MSARVATIAGGLSRPQRDAVCNGGFSGDFSLATVRALVRKGVFTVQPTSPNGRYGPAVLTDFGAAVQVYLTLLAADRFISDLHAVRPDARTYNMLTTIRRVIRQRAGGLAG